MNYPFKPLWTTEHGSAMWGMFKPGISDHDLGTVRIVPTEYIMSGYRIPETWPQIKYFKDGVEHDESFIEIGHLIDLIINGNNNYLWSVMSPIVIKDESRYQELNSGSICGGSLLQELREIIKANPSKKYYYAIKGMAGSQKLDETKRPRLSGGKGFRTAARTALYGVDLLTRWEFNFKPCEAIVNLDISEREVNECLDALDEAFENSPYPIEVNAKPYREFLFKVRRLQHEGKI